MRLAQAFAILVALGSGGCATITTGPTQAIQVATEPPGANCVLSRDGETIALIQSTPAATFVSKSGHDIAVNCAKYGRANGAAVIPANGQGAVFGNMILGGLLGYGIDLASGAAAEYPRGVRIWLDSINGERSQSSLFSDIR